MINVKSWNSYLQHFAYRSSKYVTLRDEINVLVYKGLDQFETSTVDPQWEPGWVKLAQFMLRISMSKMGFKKPLLVPLCLCFYKGGRTSFYLTVCVLLDSGPVRRTQV